MRPSIAPFWVKRIVRGADPVTGAVDARLRRDPGINPAAAGRCAVVLAFIEACQKLELTCFRVYRVRVIAVDFLQHFESVRLALNAAQRAIRQARMLVVVVIPRQMPNRLIFRLNRVCVHFFQPLA